MKLENILNLEMKDKGILMKFIFERHFTQIDFTQKVKNSLNFIDYMFNPYIKYSANNEKLIYKVSKKSKGNRIIMNIKNPNKINVEQNIKLFNSLTQSEKFCILFLLYSLKAEFQLFKEALLQENLIQLMFYQEY